jgi:hypothetical protein
MTGTDCGLFTHKSVPDIFESPCTYSLHSEAQWEAEIFWGDISFQIRFTGLRIFTEFRMISVSLLLYRYVIWISKNENLSTSHPNGGNTLLTRE